MVKVKSIKNMPRDGGIAEDYTWIRLLKKEQSLAVQKQPALFLDRDGVINKEKSFITHPDALELEEAIASLIRYYNQKSWPVIVVTNQSGIAKQKMSWATYWQIEDRLIHMLAAEGAFLDMILASPCHPEGIAPYNGSFLPSRKPAAGMIEKACEILAIDRESSIIIGDRKRDIEAGDNAGLAFGIFCNSGHKEGVVEWQDAKTDDFKSLAFYKINNMEQALPLVQKIMKDVKI